MILEISNQGISEASQYKIARDMVEIRTFENGYFERILELLDQLKAGILEE